MNSVMSISESLVLMLAGMIVVFAVLVILILLVWMISKITAFFTKRKSNNNSETKKQFSSDSSESVKKNTPVNVIKDDGIPGEVIAAITAAVSMMSQNLGKKYTLKSVKRVKQARPSWSMAGILENTRPF